MNPYYSEAFSNTFDYNSLESDADFFSSSKRRFFNNFIKRNGFTNLYNTWDSQLYEAISYWIIFSFLFWAYWKKKWHLYSGRLFGIF